MSVQPGNFFLYRGLSMWPCFQEGDLLEVKPVTPESVRVGDCVILRVGDGQHLAHRVVEVRNGLRTRGDALARSDDREAGAPQLLGRVVARHRLGHRSQVAGGWPGRLAGFVYRYAGRIDPERSGRGGRLARAIRRGCAPLVRPIVSRGALCTLAVPGGTELDLWKIGGKVVAQRSGAIGGWQVPWPWRLVIELPVQGERVT